MTPDGNHESLDFCKAEQFRRPKHGQRSGKGTVGEGEGGLWSGREDCPVMEAQVMPPPWPVPGPWLLLYNW